MLKTCQRCNRTYTPIKHDTRSLYCPTCRRIVRNETNLRSLYNHDAAIKKVWFDREWANWKRDFAAGKTQSNLGA